MPKKIPMRMCIVCREMSEKRDLLRIVKSEEGIHFDATGKKSGRGAYICKNPACFEKCVKKKFLERVFETTISDENYLTLEQEYAEHSKNN